LIIYDIKKRFICNLVGATFLDHPIYQVGLYLQRDGDACYFIAPLAISTVSAVVIAHCFLSVYEVTTGRLRLIYANICEACAVKAYVARAT